MNKNHQSYPLAISSWDNKEVEQACEIIKSGNTTMGKKVKEFEQLLSNYIGVDYSLMVNSGSSANLLMASVLKTFLELNNDSRNEIVIPAVGWSTSYSPFIQMGFKVRVCDIDINTFNLSLDSMKKCISNETAAVLAINILGNSCNLEEIYNHCQKLNIYLLEDNCESLGSITKMNNKAGSIGLMSSHSFFYSHHLNTMEGGSLSTSNKDIFLLALLQRNHGWVREVEKVIDTMKCDSEVSKYIKSLCSFKTDNELFQKDFYFIMPGFNLRPTEVQGGIGIIQINKLKDFINIRRGNLEYLEQRLAKENYPIKLQQETGRSSSFGFGFIIKENLNRNQIINQLRDKGIQTRPIVSGSIQYHPLAKKLNCDLELSNASALHERGFFIGNHHINIIPMIDLFLDNLAKL